MAHFGARGFTEEEMRAAFESHKSDIQAIAREHIANGWVDQEGCLLLTTRFTRLKITFTEGLKDRKDAYQYAVEANNVLTEIIGPNAETVNVVWDRDAPAFGSVGIVLQISDPSLPFSIKRSLGLAELLPTGVRSMILAGAWGSLLQRRSQKILSRIG
jgi:hypothetical protein